MMLIKVRAKPGSKSEKIIRIGKNEFEISIKEKAENNKANIAIIKALAEYLDCSTANFRIKSGSTSKNKIIEIKNDKI